MTDKTAVKTWADVKGLQSTADIEIPADPLDRVLGQEEAIQLAKIAAKQRRHLLLVGPPGTGKSMIARAISMQLPAPKSEIRVANTPENPERPFVAILGGAKVADKLNVISNLLEKCDTLIIGGGMAYTFIKAQGGSIGKSLVDEEKIGYCKEMLAKAEKLGKKILLPVDTAIADSFPDPIDAEISVEYVDADKIPADKMGLDIGPKTAAIFAEAAKSAKTVVWNGPMGVFENPTLKKGTVAVCEALAQADATTIIGGGDSATAAIQLGFADKMSHISTGGGASLEYLEGKVLPGVAAIAEK